MGLCSSAEWGTDVPLKWGSGNGWSPDMGKWGTGCSLLGEWGTGAPPPPPELEEWKMGGHLIFGWPPLGGIGEREFIGTC